MTPLVLLSLLAPAGAFLQPALPRANLPLRSEEPVAAEASEPVVAVADAPAEAAAEPEPAVGMAEEIPGGTKPELEDLAIGTEYTGKVKAVMAFGAFVDIGAAQDGLVHVSQLSHSFVKDVNDIVAIGDDVTVKVLDVDTEKSKLWLTMKVGEAPARSGGLSEHSVSRKAIINWGPPAFPD